MPMHNFRLLEQQIKISFDINVRLVDSDDVRPVAPGWPFSANRQKRFPYIVSRRHSCTTGHIASCSLHMSIVHKAILPSHWYGARVNFVG
ncbi:Uncharacterized protein TSPI_02326 [Trichinella spiralis]|uniref:Uncharacterized protein n=1 Tax=Trichinella spiralis TaxID=6334 RepID=A0ABR3KP83_TRISP